MKNITLKHLRENTKEYILLLSGREGFLIKIRKPKSKIKSLMNLTSLTWKSSIKRHLNVSAHRKRKLGDKNESKCSIQVI